jgi:hypothetical protein
MVVMHKKLWSTVLHPATVIIYTTIIIALREYMDGSLNLWEGYLWIGECEGKEGMKLAKLVSYTKPGKLLSAMTGIIEGEVGDGLGVVAAITVTKTALLWL